MTEDTLFFVGQKALIEKEGNILVLNDLSNRLDFPGGKIQDDEIEPIESFRREVREEVNLEIEIGNPFIIWFNDYPSHHRNFGKKIFIIVYKCIYKSGEVKLSSEHNSYSWVTKENFFEVDDQSKFFEVLKQYFCNTN